MKCILGLGLGLLFFMSLAKVQASEVVTVDSVDTAEIYRTDDPDKKIPDLNWENDSLPVERLRSDDQTRFQTVLRGSFGSPYLHVHYRIENQPMQELKLDQMHFSIPLSLTSSKLRIQFYVDKDEHTSLTEVIYIRSTLNELQNRFSFAFGLSYVLHEYKETFLTEFRIRELAVTPQFGVVYRFSPRFEVGVNGFISAIPLTMTRSPDQLEPSRFYGINGRIGYRLWEFSKKARLYLMPGWYFWGQMVPGELSANSYGVSGLGGPQVFLMARFLTNNNRQWYTFAKWAMIQDGEQWNPVNREISAGIGFQFSDPYRGRPWMLTLDVARSNYSGNKTGDEQTFELTSVGIGVSTGL
jgi:hypothetical protein